MSYVMVDVESDGPIPVWIDYDSVVLGKAGLGTVGCRNNLRTDAPGQRFRSSTPVSAIADRSKWPTLVAPNSHADGLEQMVRLRSAPLYFDPAK
jgi:hypothetical protein